MISLWFPTLATDRLNCTKIDTKNEKLSKLSPPLVTVTTQHGSLKIVAANHSANMQGIKPGLSLADSRALSPDLVVRQANPAADVKALNKLAQACERYSPWTAVDPSDSSGIWIDITGCTHLYNGERPLTQDLHDHCIQAGYQPRIGLADTPGAAWAAARFGKKSFTIISAKAQRQSLASYSVAALRIASKTIEGMKRLGLLQIRDLYNIPRAPLTSRFGGQVLRRLDQMLGKMGEPISPHQPIHAYYTRMAFAEPIGHREDIKITLDKLLEKLCLILKKSNIGARRLKLIVFRVDNTRTEIEVGTSKASCNPEYLAYLFHDNITALDPGFGIEIADLIATETNPLKACQTEITGKTSQQQNESVTKLIDRLAGRLGMDNVIFLHPIESHLPECASEAISALKTTPLYSNWKNTINNLGSYQHPIRPLELLKQPLHIDVIAPVPDGPPVVFFWRKQQHKVIHAEGPERISPEWWRPTRLKTRSRSLTQKTRDYYRLEDHNGNRYWIYREGLYHSDKKNFWYIHGFFA